MAKYLLKVRYTSDGLQGVLRDGGSARRTMAAGLGTDAGGTLESFHFAFGDDDVYAIYDLPDNAAAARVAMTVSAGGRASVTTVPLLTVEEIDAVAASGTLDYVPPGT